MATQPKLIDTAKLRQLLDKHFNEEELRTLCHDLGIDYESLGGRGKAANSRELVTHCQTHRRLDDLASSVLQLRPHIPHHSILRDASDDSPFMGLRYFGEAHTHLFFGREALTAELTAHILPPAASPLSHSSLTPFLAIVGASGSGKSSVLHAGLIPAIRRQTDWPIHVITPGSHPLKALAASLTRDSESVTAATTLMDDMAQDQRSLDLFITRQVEQFDKSPNRLLMAIDQFEEMFTQCKDEAERRAFVDNLMNATAADGPITIVLTLRADFYDHCAPYDQLREALAQHQAYIGPMNAAELRQAIERPAANARLSFEEGLVDLLLRDVGATGEQTPEPGALPLLSHALLETWQRREGDQLTLVGYHAAGGVHGAIAQTAETVYQTLPPEQQTIARNIFLRLTELGEGTQDTRRRADLDELVAQPETKPEVTAVLQRLVDTRLVTTSDEGAEVAHEVLIREWPTLRRWLDNNRESLRIQRSLTQAADTWAANNYDDSYLYRGVRLKQAIEWEIATSIPLNSQEKSFLQASREQEENELEEAKAIAERETEAANKLRQRAVFLRIALVIAAVLAISSLLLFGQSSQNASVAATRAAEAETEKAHAESAEATAIYNEEEANNAQATAESNAVLAATREAEALLARDEAKRQQQVALAQSLASLSSVILEQENNTELATLLALEAARINEKENAYLDWLVDSSLRTVLDAPYYNNILTGHEGNVLSVAVSPDGERIASASDDGTIRLWMLNDPTTPPLILNDFRGWGQVNCVSFSPDNKMLVSAHGDGTIILWTLSDLTPKIISGHTGSVMSVVISPDGKILASAGDDATVRLWDLSNFTTTKILYGHEGMITSVAFSPDGKTLASGGEDQIIRLWNIDNLDTEPKKLEGHQDTIWSVSFSPDGNLLGSTAFLDATYLWDIKNSQILTELTTQAYNGERTYTQVTLPYGVSLRTSIVFSPDGKTIAETDLGGEISLWNATELTSQPAILRDHLYVVTSVAFASDNKSMVSGGGDQTIRLWHFNEPVTQVLDQNVFASSLLFTPSSQNLIGIISEKDNPNTSVYEWNVSQPVTSPTVKIEDNYELIAVAIDPDESVLASGSKDGIIRLWDLDNPTREPMIFEGHDPDTFSMSLAFSPHGELLASGSTDGRVLLWDRYDPAATPVTLIKSEHSIQTVTFSPNGEWLVSGTSQGNVLIWKMDNLNALPSSLSGYDGKILSFSLDGTLLISTEDDETIQERNTKDLIYNPIVLPPQNSDFEELVISPSGNLLAYGSPDGTIQIWNMNNLVAKPVTLAGHESHVSSIIFSLDEKSLISSSGDGTIRLWPMLDELLAIGCQKVRRNLSWDEWQLYLPGEPYSQTCPNLPRHPSVPPDA